MAEIVPQNDVISWSISDVVLWCSGSL